MEGLKWFGIFIATMVAKALLNSLRRRWQWRKIVTRFKAKWEALNDSGQIEQLLSFYGYTVNQAHNSLSKSLERPEKNHADLLKSVLVDQYQDFLLNLTDQLEHIDFESSHCRRLAFGKQLRDEWNVLEFGKYDLAEGVEWLEHTFSKRAHLAAVARSTLLAKNMPPPPGEVGGRSEIRKQFA